MKVTSARRDTSSNVFLKILATHQLAALCYSSEETQESSLSWMGRNGKRRKTGSNLLVKERADKNRHLEYLMANKTDNSAEWEGKIPCRRKH